MPWIKDDIGGGRGLHVEEKWRVVEGQMKNENLVCKPDHNMKGNHVDNREVVNLYLDSG